MTNYVEEKGTEAINCFNFGALIRTFARDGDKGKLRSLKILIFPCVCSVWELPSLEFSSASQPRHSNLCVSGLFEKCLLC